ncbi:hypothetical protein KSP40_PGU021098 [Platanthera guangdongensis]|uniref:Protein kinase domain-containing protein n=1 Tax=Platanthera guangdongensis TaxID=2320717 RepID=A0ABR2M2C4_9ASPA
MTTGLQCKRGRTEKGGEANEKVVVAVKASKEISKNALVWALTHVVQPGNCLTLLVVMPQHSSGRKLWGFPRFSGDCASGHRRSHTGTTLEQKSDLTYLCSQMMLQLHNVYDPNKINVKVKVLSGSPSGIVAAECKRATATWVILDKQLKHEERRCMEDLQCNIVVMKRSQAKVLRLNLVGSHDAKPPEISNPLPELVVSTEDVKKDLKGGRISIPGPTVTPSSSPEVATSFTATEAGTSSMSSSDPGTSPFFISETEGCPQKAKSAAVIENQTLDVTSSDSDSDSLSPSTTLELQPWMVEILSGVQLSSNRLDGVSHRATDARISKAKALLENYCKPARQAGMNTMSFKSAWDFGGSFRETVSRTRNPPPVPPPLCSICQHKAPVFGKPPRWFSYSELELATGGFSQANFLAEGDLVLFTEGFCPMHRNLVMLIGFCVEERRRLLVYEYICNGSLDSHLYGNSFLLIGETIYPTCRYFMMTYAWLALFALGAAGSALANGALASVRLSILTPFQWDNDVTGETGMFGRNREPLEWSARHKIAVGAARGLRYLHEECRVGCIVHRDMRPNNILITHDFEPLVEVETMAMNERDKGAQRFWTIEGDSSSSRE